jgi:hypothetical protein
MKMLAQCAAAVGVAGLIAGGAAMPAHAKDGRNTAAAIGFGAGVLAGAAVANANSGYYYAPPYYRGYAYEPGYVYVQPGYGAYAYAPRPYGHGWVNSCSTEGTYGKDDDYAPCY